MICLRLRAFLRRLCGSEVVGSMEKKKVHEHTFFPCLIYPYSFQGKRYAIIRFECVTEGDAVSDVCDCEEYILVEPENINSY